MCACLIFRVFLWRHLESFWSASSIRSKEVIIHIEFEGIIIPCNIFQAHVPLFYKYLFVVVTTQSIETLFEPCFTKTFLERMVF
jgi:hypothetical protein